MWQSFWHCKCHTYFFLKCDTLQAFWFSQVKTYKKKEKKKRQGDCWCLSVFCCFMLSYCEKPPLLGKTQTLSWSSTQTFFFSKYFTSLLFLLFFSFCLFFEILHETWPFSSLGRILLCGFDFNASLQNHPCAHRKLMLSCVKQIHAPACLSFWNLKMINPIKLLYSPV